MKVVNLSRVRKEKARNEKRARGDENAVKHGRTKAQRVAEAKEAERARRHLDCVKKEP